MSLFRRSKKVQKVQIVKAKRKKRRGPRITRMLKQKTTAHLRYVDVVSVNAGSAAIASHVFRANSIFDPDFTSTGHQPLMRDEYALLYASYRVISSKIKVTPVASTTTNVVPSFYGVFRDDDSVLTYSLGTSIIEDQRNKGTWGMVAEQLDSSSKKHGTRSTSFNAKRDLGNDGQNATHEQATNPTGIDATQYYQLWSSSIAGNDPPTTNFLVQIDYIVEFTDPAVVTPS